MVSPGTPKHVTNMVAEPILLDICICGKENQKQVDLKSEHSDVDSNRSEWQFYVLTKTITLNLHF